MQRSVERIVSASHTMEGGGFPVTRPFPGPDLEQVDPFLLLDEFGPVNWGPGEAVGAPDHPHAGFEAVTYLLAGRMEHRDSRGNHGALEPGDIQWMTAGSGLVHGELPEQGYLRSGGPMHGFQLWVNLPAIDKDLPPRYQDMRSQAIPEATTPDGLVRVRVLAGEALGQRASTETRIPITYLHATLQPGGILDLSVDPDDNIFAYVFAGRGAFGPDPGDRPPEPVGAGHLVLFSRGGTAVRAAAPADTDTPLQFLFLSGRPLEEPVVRYGPFVATSQEELRRLAEDYRAGRLG